MIDNVNQFLGTVTDTEFAKAARRSARTIWNAHRAAFVTTRVEAGKVFELVVGEGRKFATRAKAPVAKKATRRATRTRHTTRRNTRRAA